MTETIDITLPDEQLEGTVATISNWLIEPGNNVTAGEPLVEIETDKVTMEVCATATGQLLEICKFTGDDVAPDTVLGKLTTCVVLDPESSPDKAEPDSKTKTEATSATINHSSAKHLVGPAVRRLLREHQLDVEQIKGSGRGGRVTRSDITAHLKQSSQMDKSTAKPASRKVPHSPMRKSIAKHMVESLLHCSPHVTSVFEMDLSNILEHRRWHRQEFAEQGVKLTLTAYFMAASVKAIGAVPEVNARYHEEALELFEDINLGIGTALGDAGLVVPVIGQVQHKTLFEIAATLQSLTDKARAGKLSPMDVKNGTFTISNHGVSGSLFAAPIIINQPQVAILGIGKMEKRVVVRSLNGNDEVQIKPMCYVSLSIDHRAIDAFQTNRFLSVLVDEIENWGNMDN